MKNPLTSKERRGLVAVAAAALLCIGSGFIFRNCGSRNAAGPAVTVIDNDSVGNGRRDSVSGKTDKAGKSGKSDRSERKKKGVKKKASERVYPTREPLDEEISISFAGSLKG